MTVRRILFKTVRIALVAWIALILLAACFYPRFLYHPDRSPSSVVPTDAGAKSYEDLWLKAADGIRINAWFVPAEQDGRSRKTLLVFHGNAGNLSTAVQRIELYRRLGFDVFMVDYHGFGKSGGTPDEKSLYFDAEAAWEYLTRDRSIPPGEIVIVGYSLGGAVASRVAELHPDASGLVLESTFTSLADIASDFFPFLPCRLIVGNAFNTRARLSAFAMPLLVVHGRGDQLVAYRHGEALFASYRGRKEFLRIADDHNLGFLLAGERYGAGLARFVDSLDEVDGAPENVNETPSKG